MKTKPELLIVADKDTLYGIKHGYYPTIKESIENGNLEVIPYGDRIEDFELSKMPIGNGEDIYIRNAFVNNYISLWDSDILNTLISDKSFAIKEVLVRMGAKHITLIEDLKDKDNTNTQMSNDAGYVGVEVKIEGKYERTASVNINSIIESHDPSRIAKTAENVSSFMTNHGLSGDAKLIMLLERLKEDGCLHGTEYYEVTFLSEIQSALSIAAQIEYNAFSDKLDFSHKHNHIHKISKKLKIEFD